MGTSKCCFKCLILCYTETSRAFPSASSDSAVDEHFNSFFADKIRLMRESLPACAAY